MQWACESCDVRCFEQEVSCWNCYKRRFPVHRNDLETPGGGEVAPSATAPLEGSQISDPVQHPSHYQWLPVEAIEITSRFNFCMGNALKYIIRADHKGNPIEDLRKSLFYIRRELKDRGYEDE